MNETLKVDFVEINCEIQQLRSENDSMIDQIKVNATIMEENKKAIDEKLELVKFFDQQISSINSCQ